MDAPNRDATSGWFCQNLGDALLAGDAQAQIEVLFRAEFARAGHPTEMAIFIRHESEGQLHCDVKLYFAPAAAAVANEVDADPCARPSPQGLSLLAGTEDAWAALFPEEMPE